jgi:hypothetical protein
MVGHGKCEAFDFTSAGKEIEGTKVRQMNEGLHVLCGFFGREE